MTTRLSTLLLLAPLALGIACDDGDGLDPIDADGAGGKADEVDEPEELGRDTIDLERWAIDHASTGTPLGEWSFMRRTYNDETARRLYAPEAALKILDSGTIAAGPEDILDYYAAEGSCFVEAKHEYLWGFREPSQFMTAVVERVSGTIAEDAQDCPLLGDVDPADAAGKRVAFHRLVVLRQSLATRGQVVDEILAYDESTVPAQLTGSATARPVDEVVDFGEATIHLARGGQRSVDLRNRAMSFDLAFANENAEDTAAFLSDEACARRCVTDLTFPADLDKAEFAGLLQGFYQAFVDISLASGDGHGSSPGGLHIVGTSATDEWVLDAFQWSATHAPSGGRVTITDYVLLQFDEDEQITRSITFKNGAALGRQLGG